MAFQYDLQKLHQLLQDFYALTGAKICVFDRSEQEICYYPEKYADFCKLIRQNPQMDARCRTCDTHAFAECRKMNAQHTYVCHAGLLECVSPITLNDQLVGYLLIGQIKQTDRPLSGTLAAFPDPHDREQLEQAYKDLVQIPPQKLQSAIRILDACTSYEHIKAIVHNEEARIDARLTDYIQQNLRRPITVADLCNRFYLSHNEVYAIFKKHFDQTPAAYIKKSRLEYAATLLAESHLPVHKIARSCGIPDYNYFSKLFKKEKGCSPTEYRKEKAAAT